MPRNPNLNVGQWLSAKTGPADTHLWTWMEAFLIDRQAQRMAAGTIYFYRAKLRLLAGFCEGRAITCIDQITPDTIRQYLLWLEATGHNPGGVHQGYRTLKTLLRWYEQEAEPEDWTNPIRKVRAPRLSVEPLQGVGLDTIRAMLDVCRDGFTGRRDRAILLTLLDTGCRAGELLAIRLADINLPAGSILISRGKGGKFRSVFFGSKTRRVLRRYLRDRQDNCPQLWVTDEGDGLTYPGLRQIIRRRAEQAGVQRPKIHDFRRAFALNFLRANPGEIYALQRLMGHADLQVLRRYLAQTDQDVQEAHRRGGPVDNSL